TVNTNFVLSNPATPAGMVTLYDGSTALSSAYLTKGSAQFTISSAIAGTHSITAQYAGTSNYAASTSAALTQTVNPSPTTLQVASGPNPSSFGQSVTLYATLTPSYGLLSNGGTVTFFDNGTQIGSAVMQGNNTVSVATTALVIGTSTITAKY